MPPKRFRPAAAAKVFPKFRARPKAKAKAGAAAPKARVRQGRRRPAAALGAQPQEKKLGDHSTAELCKLGFIKLDEAKYYQRSVKLAGTVLGVVTEGDQAFLDFKISGTKDDELLKAVTGLKDRRIRVHLCDDHCQDVLTGETLVHGRKFSQAARHDEPWFTNLEEVGMDRADVEDELAKLREADRQRREEDADAKEAKEGKKKKRKKEKKKEDSEDAKKEKERSKAKKADLEKEPGQKDTEDLFEDTGLDPDFSRRKKVLKKARRIGKSKKKKAKKSKKSASGGSSSSDDSDSSSSASGGGGLFETDKKVKRIARKYPGCLTASSLSEAKDSLLTTSGMSWGQDRTSLPPIFTHFVRQQLAHGMNPPLLQESLTLSTALDAMLMGRAAYACDIMSQRLKSLESLSQGAHWSVGRQMELVNSGGQAMAEEQESLEAARQAREAAKLKAMVSQPSAPRGGENEQGKGKKGKGWKGGGKQQKSEDGSKGQKGGGKRDDKNQWQNKNKDK